MLLPHFCRVTGNSRNLPKPNYFPLLPAISPVEARRLLGKQQQEHHLYLPVIEFARHFSSVLQCHITSHADGEHSYQPPISANHDGSAAKCRITAKHQINPNHKYVYPVLNDSNYDMAQLRKLLKRKLLPGRGQQRYVYNVEKLNLVLPDEMEQAVRSGDIENLLLSKDGSNALVRLKNGPNLSLNLRSIPPPNDEALLEGGGQDEDVLIKQKQVQQYRKRKVSDPRTSLAALTPEFKEEEIIKADWNARMTELTAGHRSASNLLVVGTDWRDLVYPQIDSWDWDDFPDLTNAPPPLPVCDVVTPVGPLPSELPVKVSLSEEVTGFETVPVYDEQIPVSSRRQPSEEFIHAVLDKVQPQSGASSSSITDKLRDLFNDAESLMVLPFLNEVTAVVEALNRGIPGWMSGSNIKEEGGGLKFVTKLPDDVISSISGQMVPLTGDEQRFVVGQQVPGQGFVPGRCTANGFRPGLVVQNAEGAAFIPGCIVDRSFVAGEIVEDKFVPGQAVQTLFGPKFLPGCTVKSEEGLKFIVGQSVEDKFHPGQVFQTESGPTWVSGVTFDTPQGARFIAGLLDKSGKFTPGQVIDGQFTPGQTVETAEGPLFVPGQSYTDPKGETHFCPGRVLQMEDGQARFVPGETIVTDKGKQFVAGVIQDSKFVPCTMEADGELHKAAREEEIFTKEGISSGDGLPIDNNTFTALPRKKPDMGYMIQHQEKIKFLPTEQNPGEILAGTDSMNYKIVPGQLLEIDDSGAKFVPGKTIESALGSIFIPGQAVKTGPKEQFVPGQVIDSRENAPMFCPGQMVQCGGELGKRFIPGQVFNTKNGPRFVPGKILTTPSGASTFIPGQVFFTDSGSRFLPGNVVETNEGPFFVPGRVVELPTGGIKFVAGEVIETDEGLRYVMPEEGMDQDEDLFVQGFPVTPEELRLITAYPFAALHYPMTEGSVINSRMLRQMTAAGVAVNRLTNNVDATKANDVKITSEVADESLLGANVFRTTEPELQPAKQGKSKIKKVSTGTDGDASLKPEQAVTQNGQPQGMKSNQSNENKGSNQLNGNEGSNQSKGNQGSNQSKGNQGSSKDDLTNGLKQSSINNSSIDDKTDKTKNMKAENMNNKDHQQADGVKNSNPADKSLDDGSMFKNLQSADSKVNNQNSSESLDAEARLREAQLIPVDPVSAAMAQNVSSIHTMSESAGLLTDGDPDDRSSASVKKTETSQQQQQPAQHQSHIGKGGLMSVTIPSEEANANSSHSNSFKDRHNESLTPGSDPSNCLAEGQQHQQTGGMTTKDQQLHKKVIVGSNEEAIHASSSGSNPSLSAFNGSGDERFGSKNKTKESLVVGQGSHEVDAPIDGSNHSLLGTETIDITKEAGTDAERQGRLKRRDGIKENGHTDLLLSKDMNESASGKEGKDNHQPSRSQLSPVSDFFARIKIDMDSLEEDPFVRETLKEAEASALNSGRPDLAEKVRSLLDILKNTEQDPDVMDLIREILTLKGSPLTNSAVREQPPNNALLTKDSTDVDSCTAKNEINRKKSLVSSKIDSEKPVPGDPKNGTKNKGPGANCNTNSDVNKLADAQPNVVKRIENEMSDGSPSIHPGGGSESAGQIHKAIPSKASETSSTSSVTTKNPNNVTESKINSTQINGQSSGISEATRSKNDLSISQLNAESAVVASSPSRLSVEGKMGDESSVQQLSNAKGSIASKTKPDRKPKAARDVKSDDEGSGKNVGVPPSGIDHESSSSVTTPSPNLNANHLDSSDIIKNECPESSPASSETSSRVGAKQQSGSIILSNQTSKTSEGLESNSCGAQQDSNSTGSAEKNSQSTLKNETTEDSSLKSSLNENETSSNKGETTGKRTKRSAKILSNPDSLVSKVTDDEKTIEIESSNNKDDVSLEENAEKNQNDSSKSTSNLDETESTGIVGRNRRISRFMKDTNGHSKNDSPGTDETINNESLSSAEAENGMKSKVDETKMVDEWTYLNSSGEDGVQKRTNGSRRRSRGNPRKVSSRSSSRSFLDLDLSEEEEIDSLNEEEPTSIPEVITSARDISRDVMETLRYSRDAAKKALYTQQILEALNPGCGSRKGSACIILKDFLQTIVPQEAAHSVLVGDIDYMVVDDEGVRYFESASGFASRRNSRYDIKQSARSRSGSRDASVADQGPWPWADVGPRNNNNRRMSIDDFRKKLHEQDSRMEPRPVTGGRHSVTGNAPLSRSNSGYIPPILSSGPGQRSSVLTDDLALQAASAVLGRKRHRSNVVPDPSVRLSRSSLIDYY